MASETITRTDLTNILNEVLPPTPSEYKKLLWTNPSPTATFSPQTVSLDLSNYDAVYIISKKTASESPYFVTESIIGVTSQTFFIEGGVSFDRQIIVNQTGIEFAVACFLLPSATVITIDNNRCVPYQIYGIKYDRVAPPQVDNAIESFSLTAQQTNTNINSQFCYYDKNTNIVHIEFTVQKSDSSTFGSSAILNVPEAYRPSETKRGESISYINASNSTIPHYVSVSTGGDITQTTSNGITHLFGLINYFLN